MIENGFTKKDVEQVVAFLNFVASRARFDDWKTEDSVNHFRMLNYMQTVLLPKIEANILEIVAVKKPEDTESKEKGKK